VATGIWNAAPLWVRPVLAIAKMFMVSPEEGARRIVYLGLEPGVAATTGSYFEKDRARKPARLAEDDALRRGCGRRARGWWGSTPRGSRVASGPGSGIIVPRAPLRMISPPERSGCATRRRADPAVDAGKHVGRGAALAAAPVQTNDSATGSQDAKRRLLNVTVTGSSAGSGTYARPSCPTQAVPEVPAETIGHPEVTAQSDDSSHLHRSLETSRPDRHRRAADICGGRLRVGALVADVERSPRSNGLSPRRFPLSDRLARSQPSPGSNVAWVAETKAMVHWQAGERNEARADIDALRRIDAKRADRFERQLHGEEK